MHWFINKGMLPQTIIDDISAKYHNVFSDGAFLENARPVGSRLGAAQMIRKVVKELGTTDDPGTAGYILPNGELLDLSGGPGSCGSRGCDHRIVSGLIGNFDSPSEGMVKFQEKTGAIRWTPEAPGFEVHVPPTYEQFQKLAEILEYYPDTIVYADFYSKKFEKQAREYPAGTSFRKIKMDINRYFQNGELSDEFMYEAQSGPDGSPSEDVFTALVTFEGNDGYDQIKEIINLYSKGVDGIIVLDMDAIGYDDYVPTVYGVRSRGCKISYSRGELEDRFGYSIKIEGESDEKVSSVSKNIASLLHDIGSIGNGGHSYAVSFIPKSSNAKIRHFGWDGDGSDRIDLDTLQINDADFKPQ